MTILGSSQFFSSMDVPMDALPLRIWRMSLLQPYDSAQEFGWGSALVLIIIILGINLGVRYYFANKKKKGFFGQLIKKGVKTKN